MDKIHNRCLTTCQSCCKFSKDEVYYAPIVMDEEIAKIKSDGLYKKVFHPFKKSKNVFQISLIKSKVSKDLFVCPYLDENTQMCIIYNIRPFDCKFWPFILMHDKERKKVFIAHFNKKICQITDVMSNAKFKEYLIKYIDNLVQQKNISELINKYPDMIWDYEPDTFMIKELS